jgi:tetratricopeptide (TPR) repeat protein
MEQHQKIVSPILDSAWERYAEFKANSISNIKRRIYLQRVAISLAMAAVALAVFLDTEIHLLWPGVTSEISRLALVVILIVDFIFLALAISVQQNETAQALRAAAEEIKKEIYFYRTIMQWHDDCDHWLSQKISKIKRDLADSFGGELALKPYKGAIPPEYDPHNPDSDPGDTRLLPDDYLRYRLDNQLDYYAQRVTRPQRNKLLLYVGLFATGGLSLLLAAIGSDFTAWTAVTIFAASALISWFGPINLDAKINTYNQLILGLQNIKDYWYGLSKEAQTGDEFIKLVVATERVIWNQYNLHASEIWRAVDELHGHEEDAFEEVLMLPGTVTLLESGLTLSQTAAAIEPSSSTNGAGQGAEAAEATNGVAQKEVSLETVAENIEAQKSPYKRPKGLPHAFVVMPFGRKQGADGRWYDFDSIYHDLIRPALEAAGFESFRADEESVSGDILTDMFQELLLADLVIADLSIDNANVFYELGVRHSLRKRGLVHIQSGRSYMPFDIFNVRTIPYHTDKNGRPDPAHLEKDKQAIIKITRETWASDVDRVHSPIFNLLDGLEEAERKTLRTPLATGFWREYNEWKERVTVAQRQKRIGDVLLLTEEISNPLIKEEAIGEAGQALKGLGRHELALQQYRRGLEINPRNSEFRRQEAFHLNRLNRTDEAIVKLERLLKDNPDDTEAISFLGRIYKQMWMETWVNEQNTRRRLKEAYEASHWLVKSISTYMEGYRLNQNDHYPGINALTGSVLMDYLAKRNGLVDDPDVAVIRENLPKLEGAVHFALESNTQQNTSDYWALVSLAELEVSIADDPKRVTRAYKRALTAARKNVYNLKSSLGQLELLQSLGFRPEFVKAGIEVLQAEINRIQFEEDVDDESRVIHQDPPQVFVFSGHPVDRPGQAEPRFPAVMEKEVREKIEKTLDKFKATQIDLAITSGAMAGGDIIFLEVCLARSMKVEIHLPFEEAPYIKEAISFAGDKWVERYYALKNHSDVTIRLQPDHLGPVKPGDNIFERNERWALYSALVHGVGRMRAIILWDGIVSNQPGGPDSMIEQVRQLGGIAEHLNTTKFDYWKAGGKVSKALDILAKEL